MGSGATTLPLGDIHDFSSKEARQLLFNKFVVILGDSNYRTIYKDLIQFLQSEETLTLPQLQGKGEVSFANDQRVEFEGLHKRNNFREVRQYQNKHHLVRFYFITRVFSEYMESILDDFKAGLEAGLVPDVVIMNSCLWDLNKYHDSGADPIRKALLEYRQNLEKFFEQLSEILPPSCLIIWNTAMPIRDAQGPLFQGKNPAMPKDVIEANFYSASLAFCYGFDVLDLHYSVRFLEDHHHTDGVHWSSWAHRCVTKLLLTHIAGAWGVQLERRRPQPGPERNMDSVNAPRPKILTSTPRDKGYPLGPLNRSNHSYFDPDTMNYSNGYVSGYRQWDPGYEARYANTGGFGYQQGSQSQFGWSSPGDNPNFQQNGHYGNGFVAGWPAHRDDPNWTNSADDSGFVHNDSYGHGFLKQHSCQPGPQHYPDRQNSGNDSGFGHNDSYGHGFVGDRLHQQNPQHRPILLDGFNHNDDSYSHGFVEERTYDPQLRRSWLNSGNDSGFSLNGSFGHGFARQPACPKGPPLQHPGQLGPGNDPSFQEDVSFHKGNLVGYGSDRLPHPEPPPHRQRAPPNMAEMHQNGFPPPGPIDDRMVRPPFLSPYGSPQEARGRYRNRYLIDCQQSQKNVPYKKPRNGSRKARGSRKPTSRPPYSL